ncbi:hypothetical protein BH78_02400 [Pseudomonas aeruginosa C1913C]|nr:hypothetical protein BH78_02400 [Pseudomonas aeruginosa C1913C]
MAAFENQQRLADRAATDVEGLGDLLLLDTFPFLEFSPDDAFREVVGDLLCQAVRALNVMVILLSRGAFSGGIWMGSVTQGVTPPASRRSGGQNEGWDGAGRPREDNCQTI